VILDVPEDQKTCPEHGDRQFIGYDQQEKLVVIPPQMIIERTLIPKYACTKASECGVVAAAARPKGLVEGNKYDTSVAAEIMVAKYAYHMPVYRQQDLFASCGWTPARSTLLNILKSAAHLIRPLVAHLREEECRHDESGKQFGNRVPVIRDWHRPITVVKILGVVDAERRMDRRKEIGHAHGVAHDLLRQFIRFAVRSDVIEPAASKDAGKRRPLMSAAPAAVEFRRAAELGRDDDQHLVQHRALVQVENQR
jgi:transposase